ncbi:MAG: hypothetical protein IJ643_11415 [Eubacterium sp.]|nr:hypothetical protein [Eubacterium sp.]
MKIVTETRFSMKELAKGLYNMAQKDTTKYEVYFYYLDRTGHEDTDIDCIMSMIIAEHDDANTGCKYSLDYLYAVEDDIDLESAVDWINSNNGYYESFVIFNNSPLMLELYNRASKSKKRGVKITLVNLQEEIFAKWHMANDKQFNGYLA